MSVKKPEIITSYRLGSSIKTWGKYSPKYIVIHFTGGYSMNSDNLGGMLSCYSNFIKAKTNAHYLVGKEAIWEMVNPKLFYCKASCGSSVGKKNPCVIVGWGPRTYMGPLSMSHAAVAGHTNTINIEVCSCKVGPKVCRPMDDGWYFSQGTYKNAVNLCAWLCDEFGIKINDIIMHNQVTGKLCPAMWCNKPGAEEGFNKFKMDVSIVLNDVVNENVVCEPIPQPSQISVEPDSLFYSKPSTDSPVVDISTSSSYMDYTLKNGDFYYTDKGWLLKKT